jgi:hypothetical protein
MTCYPYSLTKTVRLSPGDGIVMTLLQKDGTAYNLLLWQSRAQIRDALNALRGEFSVTIIDADKGIVRLSLPNPGSVGALPAGDYVFNILLWNGANEDRLAPIKLRILEAVTVRPTP